MEKNIDYLLKRYTIKRFHRDLWYARKASLTVLTDLTDPTLFSSPRKTTCKEGWKCHAWRTNKTCIYDHSITYQDFEVILQQALRSSFNLNAKSLKSSILCPSGVSCAVSLRGHSCQFIHLYDPLFLDNCRVENELYAESKNRWSYSLAVLYICRKVLYSFAYIPDLPMWLILCYGNQHWGDIQTYKFSCQAIYNQCHCIPLSVTNNKCFFCNQVIRKTSNDICSSLAAFPPPSCCLDWAQNLL